MSADNSYSWYARDTSFTPIDILFAGKTSVASLNGMIKFCSVKPDESNSFEVLIETFKF